MSRDFGTRELRRGWSRILGIIASFFSRISSANLLFSAGDRLVCEFHRQFGVTGLKLLTSVIKMASNILVF